MHAGCSATRIRFAENVLFTYERNACQCNTPSHVRAKAVACRFTLNEARHCCTLPLWPQRRLWRHARRLLGCTCHRGGVAIHRERFAAGACCAHSPIREGGFENPVRHMHPPVNGHLENLEISAVVSQGAPHTGGVRARTSLGVWPRSSGQGDSYGRFFGGMGESTGC